MSEQEKREDGWYWVVSHLGAKPRPSQYKDGIWYEIDDVGEAICWIDEHWLEIGPRVQRDSEVVRQRDELLSELRIVISYLPEELRDIAWRLVNRIEADKSGVKP